MNSNSNPVCASRGRRGVLWTIAAVGLFSVLAACGGGGGGGAPAAGPVTAPPPPPPPPASDAVVVYRARASAQGVSALFRAGDGVQLSNASDGHVGSFAVSPDRRYVIYLAAELGRPSVQNLWRVDVQSPNQRVRLNGALVDFGSVRQFALSPDGTKIVYAADGDTLNVTEIYVVDIDGILPRRISGSVGSPAVVKLGLPDRPWSADGNYVIQFVDDLASGRRIGVNIHDTRVGSRHSVRLTPPLAGRTQIHGVRWLPDSTGIVFTADPVPNVPLLWLARIAAPGAATRLGDVLPEGGVHSFEVTPDGKGVVYVASREAPPTGRAQLYHASIEFPGDWFTLGTPVTQAPGVMSFLLSADGRRVVYSTIEGMTTGVATLRTASATELSNSVTLEQVNSPEQSLGQFGITADGTTVFYATGPFDVNAVRAYYKIFRRGVDGTGMTRIDGGTLATGGVALFQLTADGRDIVYMGDLEAPLKVELYRTSLAAPGVRHRISGALDATGAVQEFGLR